ncbi:MAG TPA: TetR/AcrR family transcriptional regulator [Acidimicrobiales bacterium]|nr:TetR/AcrR family transcriptional regulator [Acidimicrobiales bacterium]
MLPISETLTQRAVARAVASRQEAYADELQRIVEATYRVIGKTGTVDPTLRDILRESKLSTQAFYRYFTSKDELLLVLLDDGARRLEGYLRHRMERAGAPDGQVRAWVGGVLHQAADEGAARRTRPFMANEARLAERFPEEQQASVDLLVGLLVPAVSELAGGRPADARRDADAVYHLAFGALRRHLVRGTQPGRAEVEHLSRFALAGIGAT